MDELLKALKPRSKKKTSPEQFELLRAEMGIHTAAALGYGSGRDRNIVDAEWREITDKLNAIGPPVRTTSEWKKVWSDVRLRSKRSVCEDFQSSYKSNSDDDLLMETLNNASAFYNSQNSSDQDYEPHEEHVQEFSPVATEYEKNREKRMEKRNNRKKKTTPAQFSLLKSEMNHLPLAAQGYATGKKRGKVDKEWKELVVKLNKLGPPYRTMTEWKKVWSDVRLRVKKNLGKPAKPGKSRHIKKESESDDVTFTESLNDTNCVYADGGKYPIPPAVEIQTATSSSNVSHPYVVIERNPLDENEYRCNNDDTSSFHPDYAISEIDESQCNDITGPEIQKNNLSGEETLNLLQMQSEQNDKIHQHLTKISSTMCEVLHQQVTALKRRNLLLEYQTKTNDFNNFLQRRQELRRKGRSKICEWF